MKKIIEIMEFDDEKHKIELDNFEDIIRITVEVITGDEILHILRKDYSDEHYECSDCRLCDFNDGSYVIYDTIQNIDVIEQWSKRTSSYDTPIEGKEYDNVDKEVK